MRLIALIFIVGWFSSCSLKDKEPLADVSRMPDIDMLLMDSITHLRTAEIPKNKPVIFLFFRPDCPHCQQETKMFIENIASLKDVRIILLTTSAFDKAKFFYEGFNISKYPNMTVAQDFNKIFLKAFRPKGVPYTVIYDKDKSLVKIFHGEIAISSVINAIKI